MNVIHDEIKAAAEKELAAAIAKHGLHHSLHEKWAVMWEECEEAEEELNDITENMERMWTAVRKDIPIVANQSAERVKHAALRLAEEAVQIAAMARKAVEHV